MHQVVVKIDGWREVSPVSVDRVGVYFRQADPEINTSSSLVSTSPYNTFRTAWKSVEARWFTQGVKFLFFPIFLSMLLFFLFFSNFLLFFLFF